LNNELIINASPEGVRIALLKEKQIVEYHVEQEGSQFVVGDIYLGVIKKLVPGMNAAFVDVGYEKDGFLHYLDLGANVRSLLKYTKEVIAKRQQSAFLKGFKLESEIDKMGKIEEVLQKNTPILVQIAKEPISTKGPRLACELSLAGRYLVLVPFSDAVSISKKIVSRDERQRLSKLVNSVKPENFGVIVRTVAENVELSEIEADLQSLMQKWQEGYKNLKEAMPREKVIGEIGRVSAILRDMLNDNFDNIVVDDKLLYEEIRGYIKKIAPKQEKIVKLHNSKTKIFETLGIERQLKGLFGKTVPLSGGGYLIIEHTEALHVIDVNSGNKSSSEADQEATALNVNLEAATEIARQLRMRDMGGIVVIDFIDMKKADNKRIIYEKMKEAMADDRAKHTILPLTRFGLMQVTRQRVRPEVNIATLEDCSACGGTGKIGASIIVSDLIEQNLEYLIQKNNEKGIQLIVHPYLYAYFTKGWFRSKRFKWFFRYGRWVKILADSSFGINEFRFKNKQEEEIEM
jgi:ribonuclease G